MTKHQDSGISGGVGGAGAGTSHSLKSVGLVMLISTLARGLSLAGSMFYTAWFGYTLETDIYSYAINLPNLIFTCIGTALVTVVIPIFAGRLASGEADKAYGFIDNVISFSLIVATIIAVGGIFVSPLIVGMIDKFRIGDPTLALFALRLMFPVMLFHAVSYILQGVLQTNGRYLLPAGISAFSGLSVIAYIVFFAGRFGIRGLLIATFAGLAAQAIVLIPPVVRTIKYKYKPSLDLHDADMRLAGRLALPVLVSSSSYQFNMFMNSTFAASFSGGVLTITNMLTLAFTAAQLFIISALSVFFPKMSARYATGDAEGFRGAYNSVLRLIIVFAVPASAALAYLSRLLIPLLYGRGKVTASDMAISSAVFAIYAAAIASIGFKEAADRAFYSIRDSRTPAVVSIVIMALNISLSLLLMKKIGLIGLPIAYLAAITTGAAILLLILHTRLPRIGAPAHTATAAHTPTDAPAHTTTSAPAHTPTDAPAHTATASPTPTSAPAPTATAAPTPTGAPAHTPTGAPAPLSANSSTRRAGLASLAIKCALSVSAMLAVLVITELIIYRIAPVNTAAATTAATATTPVHTTTTAAANAAATVATVDAKSPAVRTGTVRHFIEFAATALSSQPNDVSLIYQIIRLAAMILSGAAAYAAASCALGVSEARNLWRALIRKLS